MQNRRILRVVAFISLLLVEANLAFARAGGGGGYSSGGGSSSSGGGYSYSSGGSGSGTPATLFDFIVMLAVLAVGIYFAVQQRKVDAARAARQKALEAQLAQRFRATDPEFDVARLTERIESAFVAIQQAWSEQDLSTVRGFMSDGLHERFSIQLREQRALGFRNIVKDVRVRQTRILAVDQNEHFETIAFEIRAYATDYRADIETGKELAGSRRSSTFTEVWEFLRARGAGSCNDAGLFEGRCPNCSAPLEPARAWSCDSCASELTSAPPDWVLTEITQRSVWSPSGSATPEGWIELTDLDPGLTTKQVEDRGAVLFWRTMDAIRQGESGPIASHAAPRFLNNPEIRRQQTSKRYIGDCAVGAAILRAAVAGADWHRVMIEVRWAGGLYERNPHGAPRTLGERRQRVSYLVLARKAEVRSHVGRCVTSAHCIRCGAPDQGALNGLCDFCGTSISDGRDWWIEAMHEAGAREVHDFLRAAEGKPPDDWQNSAPATATTLSDQLVSSRVAGHAMPLAERESLMAWCYATAYSDAQFEPEERIALDQLRQELALDDGKARSMRREAQFGRLNVSLPESEIDRQRWHAALQGIAASDHRLDLRERALLNQLAGFLERP